MTSHLTALRAAAKVWRGKSSHGAIHSFEPKEQEIGLAAVGSLPGIQNLDSLTLEDISFLPAALLHPKGCGGNRVKFLFGFVVLERLRASLTVRDLLLHPSNHSVLPLGRAAHHPELGKARAAGSWRPHENFWSASAHTLESALNISKACNKGSIVGHLGGGFPPDPTERGACSPQDKTGRFQANEGSGGVVDERRVSTSMGGMLLPNVQRGKKILVSPWPMASSLPLVVSLRRKQWASRGWPFLRGRRCDKRGG
jgi:hypothetical protein